MTYLRLVSVQCEARLCEFCILLSLDPNWKYLNQTGSAGAGDLFLDRRCHYKKA